jgi:Zn finger protein HypA/HybF involved in hydrogenase expression
MQSDSFFSVSPSRRSFLTSHHDSTHHSSRTPLSTEDNERFQYATCPQCRSDRARLTRQILESLRLFSILCPFCGYEDSDVSEH